jgi:geranylgeranylglycerol-phosphate geranylgeranyltransferase
MNPYIELIRPNVSLLAIFGLIVGLILVDIPIQLWTLPILTAFLITSSGNVINDYFDFKIDKINKPNRPIPAGKIHRKDALFFYSILVSLGLVISSYISLNFFLLTLLNSILAFIYSKKLKTTLLGNSIDSWLASSVFIAPIFIINGVSLILSSPATMLAIIAFFGNYGREVLKDVEDIKGDKINGAETLPIILGNLKATIFGKALILLTSLLLFLPYIFGFFSGLYLYFAIALFLFSIYILRINDVKKVQKMMKILMFLVIFSFLIALFFG